MSMTFSPSLPFFFVSSPRCLPRTASHFLPQVISRSLALSSRFAAASRSAWSFSTESHLSWPKFWVGIQSGFAGFPEIKCLPQTRPWSKVLSVRSFRQMAEIHVVSPFLGKISYFFALISYNWRYSCHINYFMANRSGSTAKNRSQNHFF